MEKYVKKIASLALALITCVALVNMYGCRKVKEKKPKKTTKTVERRVDVKNTKIKSLKFKEPAELG